MLVSGGAGGRTRTWARRCSSLHSEFIAKKNKKGGTQTLHLTLTPTQGRFLTLSNMFAEGKNRAKATGRCMKNEFVSGPPHHSQKISPPTPTPDPSEELTVIPPASLSLDTTEASYDGRYPSSILLAAVVGTPWVHRLSLTPSGTPSSGSASVSLHPSATYDTFA